MLDAGVGILVVEVGLMAVKEGFMAVEEGLMVVEEEGLMTMMAVEEGMMAGLMMFGEEGLLDAGVVVEEGLMVVKKGLMTLMPRKTAPDSMCAAGSIAGPYMPFRAECADK